MTSSSLVPSMTAAIAAFRAGNAPHILQVFEVGTATMMAAKGAIVPVAKVMTDAGMKFDPSIYVPAVAGYYTAPNGQMLSYPFNSSTPATPSRCRCSPTTATPRPTTCGRSAVSVPVNADFEGGYAVEPDGVAVNVALAVRTGIAGLSIEDASGDPADPLLDFDLSVERIRAARAAIDESGTGIMLVGRSEGFIVGRPDLAETIRPNTSERRASAVKLANVLMAYLEHKGKEVARPAERSLPQVSMCCHQTRLYPSLSVVCGHHNQSHQVSSYG